MLLINILLLSSVESNLMLKDSFAIPEITISLLPKFGNLTNSNWFWSISLSLGKEQMVNMPERLSNKTISCILPRSLVILHLVCILSGCPHLSQHALRGKRCCGTRHSQRIRNMVCFSLMRRILKRGIRQATLSDHRTLSQARHKISDPLLVWFR